LKNIELLSTYKADKSLKR